MLQIIDQRWRDHLAEMDYLREGINLRAMGNQDPLVAWQREGFEMFGKLMDGIDDDYLRYVIHVQVLAEPAAEPDLARANYLAADDPVQGDAAISRGLRRRHAGRARGGHRWRPAVATARSRGVTNRLPTTARPRRPSSSPTARRSGATSRAGAGAARSSSSATAPTEMARPTAPVGGRRARARRPPRARWPRWPTACARPSASSASTGWPSGGPSSRRRPPRRTCGTTPSTPAR